MNPEDENYHNDRDPGKADILKHIMENSGIELISFDDTSITTLDSHCGLALLSQQIKYFYDYDREQLSESEIVYRIKTKLDYIPKLGEIRLRVVENGSLLSLHEPDLPTLGDEIAFNVHAIVKKEEESTPDEVSNENKIDARGKQMQAWPDFRQRFLQTLKFIILEAYAYNQPQIDDNVSAPMSQPASSTKQPSPISGELPNDLPHPDDTVKRYGTGRDLTKNDVRLHVRLCRQYQERRLTVRDYYNNLGQSPPFSYETLRSYLKNPDFVPDRETDTG